MLLTVLINIKLDNKFLLTILGSISRLKYRSSVGFEFYESKYAFFAIGFGYFNFKD